MPLWYVHPVLGIYFQLTRISVQGRVPCILLSLRVKGETVVCSSNAVLERLVEPRRTLARAPLVRFRVRGVSVNDHCHHIRSRVESISWTGLLRKSCSTATDSILTTCSQWLILVLYGIAGALFAYCVSMATASPLAAFAFGAAYQIIMFTVRRLHLSKFESTY